MRNTSTRVPLTEIALTPFRGTARRAKRPSAASVASPPHNKTGLKFAHYSDDAVATGSTLACCRIDYKRRARTFPTVNAGMSSGVRAATGRHRGIVSGAYPSRMLANHQIRDS